MLSFLNFKGVLRIVYNSTQQYALVLSIAIGFTTAVNAQTKKPSITTKNNAHSVEQKFSIGLSAGGTINDFSSGQPHTNSNIGYTAGVSVSYKVINNFSLQLEVNYLQQGGRSLQFKDDTRLGLPETLETKNVTNSSFKLNSIEIPLLIGYQFSKKSVFIPTLYAGGSYAYIYNVTEKYQKTGNLLPGEDVIATVSGKRNADRSFNQSNLSLIAGANIKVPLSSKMFLTVDFRYMNGINAIRENYSYMDKVGFGTDVRVNTFLSKIGLIIPIK